MSPAIRLLQSASILAAIALAAEDARRPDPRDYRPPELRTLIAAGDDLRGPIERYEADLGNLTRFHDVPGAPSRDRALRQFYAAWISALATLDFDKLGSEARMDFVLFRNTLHHESAELDRDRRNWQEVAPLLPFAPAILDLMEKRQQLMPLEPACRSDHAGFTEQADLRPRAHVER